MIRRALLLLVLALACAGCSVANVSGAQKPLGSPVAVLGIAGQESPEIASSPVSGSAIEPTRAAPTATQPDYAATKRAAAMQEIGITQTAEHNAVLLAQAVAVKASVQGTGDEKNRISANRARDAQAAQVFARMTQDADHATQTAVAPAQALQAADDAAQAQTAGYRAVALPTMQISVAFVCLVIAACLIGYVTSKWRGQRVAQGEESQAQQVHPEYAELSPIPATGTLRVVVVPAGVTRPHIAALAQTVARTGNEHGIPFTRSNWRDVFPRAEWDALIAWMLEPRQMYVRKVHPEKENSSLILTPQGEQWLSMFENDPAPTDGEYPISAGLSSANPAGQVE